jgi:subtilisin family serine protease
MDFTNRRLHPKLRVICNGGDAVNAQRALVSNSVTTAAQTPSRASAVALCTRAAVDAGLASGSLLATSKSVGKRPKLSAVGSAKRAFVNVFVETQHSDPGTPSVMPGVVQALQAHAEQVIAEGMPAVVLPRRNFVAATVPVSALPEIAALPGVSFVHNADSLTFNLPTANHQDKPKAPTPRTVKLGTQRRTGAKVLIGIIDVGGFDFSHPDFLDSTGNTRFVAIWDQGSEFRSPPKQFNYGAEFDQKRLNNALASSRKKGGLPATLLEPQSQQSIGSHGTHVASIAAGNSGVCPDARIAAVTVSLPMPEDEREARQWTFSDSSRIVHAVEYLLDVARSEGLPISINISLGTNGGAHDGSNGPCRWFDSALSIPGRSICVAAGNAGQEKADYSGDLGWITGRIHTSGRLASAGLDVDLEWVVVGDGIADVSENELEIWYGAQDRITVSVQPPGSAEWFEVKPRQYIENKPLRNGTVLSIYSELYHPTNGENYIAVYLTPHYGDENYRPVAPGVWRVRLHGDEIRDGTYHAWIERDDPMELGRISQLTAYRFPSFFSEATNVDSHSIGSLGCSHRVVAVANIDSDANRVHISSSQGPTRDGRSKPDIAARGTNVVAAKGFGDVGDTWVSMTGTSMASPYVCGVIGLMLEAKPGLNAAQCSGILRRTARPLPSHGYAWRNDAGYGLIDPVEAIREAMAYDTRLEV